MAENPEIPEDSEEVALAKLVGHAPVEPTPLREFAVATHELYVELKAVGFPPRALNHIIASMLSDVVTGRIFEEDFEDDDDSDFDVDEGDFSNDGDDS